MPPATSTFVVAAIIRRDERVLLIEERDIGDTESTWMLPGGKVEAGETLIQALQRELAEETGLRLTSNPAWIATDEAFSRLRCVSWYDCIPLERYLSGDVRAGATYVADQR